jgi:hypothetical protein
MLFAAMQVYRAIVTILHMQADSFLVELSAGVQIQDVEYDVAGPNDVEWWIEDVSRDGHTES